MITGATSFLATQCKTQRSNSGIICRSSGSSSCSSMPACRLREREIATSQPAVELTGSTQSRRREELSSRERSRVAERGEERRGEGLKRERERGRGRDYTERGEGEGQSRREREEAERQRLERLERLERARVARVER